MKTYLRGLCWLLVLLAVPLARAEESAPASPAVIAAVRAGDRRGVESALKQTDAITVRDDRGNTALHWAALANDARLVARLVAAGADVRATNRAGATPLHYGTGNVEIVRTLLKAGAEVNAQSVMGSTPLHTAVVRQKSDQSVKVLLDAGANMQTLRVYFPDSDPNLGAMAMNSPLSLAINYGDPKTAELLLERGAAPGGAVGFTPVAAAAFTGRKEWVEKLVQRGGLVNFDEGFLGHALNNALYSDHRDVVPYLIEHGADLHMVTSFGERTPPMVWAAYTETADLSVAKAMLARKVDVNEATAAGHTALDWAMKRGDTALVAYLKSQGGTTSKMVPRAKSAPEIAVPADQTARSALLRDSVQRAVDILQRGSDGFLNNAFVRKTECVSCHAQTLPAVAYGRARDRGFKIDEASLARQLQVQHGKMSKARDSAYELVEPTPDSPTSLGYGLWGMKSVGYASDELTESLVWYLANAQYPDGSFPAFDRRPPMEEGQMIGTAFAIGALRLYPQPLHTMKLEQTFAKTRVWLKNYKPRDPNEEIHRLLGLGWAGAQPSELKPIVQAVLANQRADGGWAALPTLASDAWATGLTLFVLHEVGRIPVEDTRYRRGVDFLLRTQFADGSWWVPTRTWPLQPHFDSGFPHGRDQWISSGGTAWAVIALLNELPSVAPRENFPTAQTLMARFPAPSVDRSRPSASPNVAATAPAPAVVDPIFARDILPIFEKSCFGCHKGEKPKGEFSLESVAAILKGGQSGEAAILPGRPEASPLLRFVQDQVEDLEMPPLSKRAKYPALTKEEVAALDHWISLIAIAPPAAGTH